MKLLATVMSQGCSVRREGENALVDVLTRGNFFGGIPLSPFGTEGAHLLEGNGRFCRIDRM